MTASRRGATARHGAGVKWGKAPLVLGACLLLGLGGAGWAAASALSNDDDTMPTAGQSPVTRSTPTTNGPAVDAVLIACRAEVSAAEGVVAALKPAAAQWSGHAETERLLEAKKISGPEAVKRWDAQHKAGPATLRTLAARMKDYDDHRGDCRQVYRITEVGQAKVTAQQCFARSSALSNVITPGNVVATQWKQHLDAHQRKKSVSQAAYHQDWLRAVEAARPAFEGYQRALVTLEKTPACPS